MESRDQSVRKSAVIESVIILAGNTAGIWLTYIIAVYFFDGIVPAGWQGFSYFVRNGTFLIVTYSFLTTIIIANIERRRFNSNIWSVSAIVLFFATIILHARNIGLNSLTPGTSESQIVLTAPCVASFLLLVGSAIRTRTDYYKGRKMLVGPTEKPSISEVYTVFISYAIAGNKTPLHRDQTRSEVDRIRGLLAELKYEPIFSADNHNLKLHDAKGTDKPKEFRYPPPSQAAKLDLRAIDSSINFILYYPQATATSAIFELGYALRAGKRVLVITPKIEELPFLLRGLKDVYEDVNILVYDEFDDMLVTLRENHDSYLSR